MSETGAAVRPLRIAMVGHKGIPALHGGIERHVDEIARRLAARGHSVDVFNRGYHPWREASWQGVHLRRRPSLSSKHLDAASHTLWCVLESIVSRRYDVLHVHGIGPGMFVALSAPFLPTVFTFHAQDYRQRKWGRIARWSLRRGEKTAVQRAHAVVTVSQLLQRHVREAYGRDAIYIPNGASPAAPQAANELAQWNLGPDGYVLFVGRLISDRGLGALLEAWAAVDDPRPLVIAGDVQHDRDYVERLRRHAGPRVVFTGFQSGTALAQLYANAALCVHPSEVEGLPIAVLEAMSHGRAVLVSDIPENLEAIGDCGATFPVRDAVALAAALRRLLADPQQRAALGARARERIRAHFDWDRITDATETVYRRAIGGSETDLRLENAANRLRQSASN